MFRLLIGGLGALAIALPAIAQEPPFPASFRTQEIVANGTTIHVRLGSVGPGVLLLHGYGETADMWAPIAAALMDHHTVVVLHRDEMGLFSGPSGGKEAKR